MSIKSTKRNAGSIYQIKYVACAKVPPELKKEIVKLKKESNNTNNILRILEDRSRRDDLRFDGIEEWEEESWADTEQNLKYTLREILGIQKVKDEKIPSCRG